MAAPTDLEIEHRRIAIADFTADDDWATDRVFPTEGPDLESGQARPIQAESSRVVVFFEAYDGVDDESLPVTDAAVQVTMQVVTKYSVRGNVVVCVGPAVTMGAHDRGIEVEISKRGVSFVRVTAVADAGEDTLAIHIFADDRMAS